MSLREWIVEHGRAVGFDRVGIAPATDLPELAHFPEWLARGHAGRMDYLPDPRRRDVRVLMPSARSVICCALVYDTPQPRSTETPPDPKRGWLSRYAWGNDYHDIVRERLERLHAALAEKAGLGFEARAYVDTGPVLERVYAHHAGLGWLGKNTCLLDKHLGSFFFLGVLITNLDLQPDTPPPDACGACTLCLDACPTGALVAPYRLDARRCISYLTIELRDSIPQEFRVPMGRHVFGCDICQDVCPYNQRSPRTSDPAFEPRAAFSGEVGEGLAPSHSDEGTAFVAQSPMASGGSLFHTDLDWLASLTEESFRRVFHSSAVKRTKHRGLLRNTLIAMGNSRNPRFRPALERFATSDDPLLREHAAWALQQMGEDNGGSDPARAGRLSP